MSAQNTHSTFWKVIKLNVRQEGYILKFSYKLPKHLEIIQEMNIVCVPEGTSDNPVIECGELSVSVNNRKGHIVHTTVSYNPDLNDHMDGTMKLNASIEANSIFTGYYRDASLMKDEHDQFLPYQVKLTMLCKKKETQ